MIKNPPANAGDARDVEFDLLEEEMATRCNIPTWRIPRTEEPGKLQSMGSLSPTPLSTHMPPPASSFSSFILSAQESWRRQDGEQKMMLEFSFLCSSSGVVEGQRVMVKLIEKLSNLNNSGFCQPSPPQRNLT